MIGEQPTGAITGALITAVAHEGLRVTFNGVPAQLAIVSKDGEILAAGPRVAIEAEAVALNNYRNFLKGKGYLRVISAPILSTPKSPHLS